MWPLKTILFIIIYATLCAQSMINPIWGVINYMLIYQIDPQRTWWGYPLRDLGIRFSFYAAIFMLIGVLLSNRRSSSPSPRGSSWELGIILIVAFGFLSTLIGVEYTSETTARMDKLWKMMLFVLVFTRLVTTFDDLRWALWCLSWGTLYLGREAFNADSGHFFLGRLNDIGGPDFRFSSGFAVHLAAVIPLVGATFLIARRWYTKLIVLITGGFAVNALILCRTRSAFMGLVAGALVALVATPRQGRYRILTVLFACGVIAVHLTDHGFWERMLTISDPVTHQTDQAIITRLDIWKLTLKMIGDHPFGVGAGNFERTIRLYYNERRAAHNTFLNCAAELGIHTAVIFFILLVSNFYRLHGCVRAADHLRHPREAQFIAYGVLVSLVTYVVAGSFTERFYTESFWWVMALPLCLQRAIDHELETQLRPSRKTRHHAFASYDPGELLASVPHGRRERHGYSTP